MTLYRILLTTSLSALVAMAFETPGWGNGPYTQTRGKGLSYLQVREAAISLPLQTVRGAANLPPAAAHSNIKIVDVPGLSATTSHLGGSPQAVAMRGAENARAVNVRSAGTGDSSRDVTRSLSATQETAGKVTSSANAVSSPTELEFLQ